MCMRSADLLKYLIWDNLALKRVKLLSLLMYDTINHNVPKFLGVLFSYDLYKVTRANHSYKRKRS